MATRLDELALFRQLQEDIIPRLLKMVADGASEKDIYAAVGPALAAKIATKALREDDTSKAVAAAKEIFDRNLGKPKEQINHTHKYENLKDEELDSLLSSKLNEVAEDGDKNDGPH